MVTTTSPATLAEQRLHMLEDIARSLSEGDVVFPVCFDASIRISSLMKKPDASLKEIAIEVQKEPLITSKLLQMANSTAFNPQNQQVVDAFSAIQRLGLQRARSVALACAMHQMARSRDTQQFEELTQHWFRHSLQAAAAAQVFALRLTRVPPDLAFLAGLVHDLGAFFLLDRARDYPELLERPESLRYLIAQWHSSIGASLLDALGLPEELCEAVRENDLLRRPSVLQPRTLADVLYLANLFADGVDELRMQDIPDYQDPDELQHPPFLALNEEIERIKHVMLAGW